MLKYVEGDLIKLAKEGKYDVICHGCNCFNTMGAGIARVIAKEFKEVYDADQKTLQGDASKLGTILPVSIKNSDLIVINAYTQYHYNLKCMPNINYNALQNCFKSIKEQYGNKSIKFGIPKIGAGLAGGNWNIIAKIIEREMADEDITVVVLKEK